MSKLLSGIEAPGHFISYHLPPRHDVTLHLNVPRRGPTMNQSYMPGLPCFQGWARGVVVNLSPPGDGLSEAVFSPTVEDLKRSWGCRLVRCNQDPSLAGREVMSRGYSTTAVICLCALAFFAGCFVQQLPGLPDVSTGVGFRAAQDCS